MSSPVPAVAATRNPGLAHAIDRVDRTITGLLARSGVPVLRIGLGLVFLWFGALKLIPGLSPAADLAARTIEQLSLGLVPADVAVPVLGAWEALIGLGLLTGLFLRTTLFLLVVQMAGTVTPLLLFPARRSAASRSCPRSRGSTSSRTWCSSGRRWSSGRRCGAAGWCRSRYAHRALPSDATLGGTVAQFDLPIDQLRRYTPDLPAPDDLDAFWADTLAEARAHDLGATFTPVDTGLRLVETFDVTFRGFGGQPVKGWLQLPVGRTGPLPAVVQYIGYGGGRGLAHELILYAVAGYAHFVMDTRGQGSSWSVGETPDPDPDGAPFHPGFMTRGVLDPATYYYRRVYTDAVRAVEAARSHPAVDATRVAVTGGSQGGGIAIAAGRAGGRAGGRGPRRAVPVRLPARHDARGHAAVRRDRPLPQGPPRPRGRA